jgi:hypothetical protein
MKKLFLIVNLVLLNFCFLFAQVTVYVAVSGNDENSGTKDSPFATLYRAQKEVEIIMNKKAQPVEVLVEGGTHYLDKPLIFTSENDGTSTANISYKATGKDVVTISGGVKLDCKWKPYKDNIMMCELEEVKNGDLVFSQLFINGKRYHLARYPDFDMSEPGQTGYTWPIGAIPEEVKNPDPYGFDDITQNDMPPLGIVYDPDKFTTKRWKNPKEAIIHIFQHKHWGNLQWTVKDVDFENHYIWFGKGGHQIGAKWHSKVISVNNESQFFIENVFEELDAPGEWYLDKENGILYCIPEEGVLLENAIVEVPVLQQVIQFLGDQYSPVQYISFEGFRFAHTTSTFMELYSIPSLSDWAIHRGGAVFMDGAENITIKDCWFDALGGNAVFMNNYNRWNEVSGCKFTELGESAICFVGSLEFTNGTSRAFPYECKAHNNLIHDCGYYGKQVAGVYISRAKRITASHNLIYNMPRTGICIGDGTWGGHLIEFNHMYDCIRETWDHAPFNSWGREPYWCLAHSHNETDFLAPHYAGNVKIWAMEPVIVRNNYIHGNVGYLDEGYRQAIVLDDGSSNYHVYNNVCVNLGIGIREGDYRTVENNIIIQPVVPFGVHVGHPGNNDIFRKNIIITDYDIYYMNEAPAEHPLISEMNQNIYYNPVPGWKDRTTISVKHRGNAIRKYSFGEWQKAGYDVDSKVVSESVLYDYKNGDFRVRPNSLAKEMGFKDIDTSWGLTEEFPKKWRE